MIIQRVAFLLVIVSLAFSHFCFADAAAPVATNDPQPADPFSFADFTWLNGNSRQKDFPLDTKVFTGEFSLDTNYIYDFANPRDHTLVGSSNSGRTGEFQVEQLGIGGDFHYQNVRGRMFTQFGNYSTLNPHNDGSVSRGQWDLEDAYRYLSEAYGGYHFDVWNGINIDAGLFLSYVGLESYYNFENWNYQMSFVSSNTPWYFNGIRIQTFPSDRLKIEYWIVNGWQSYGMYNNAPGVGSQLLWRPSGNWSFNSNEYYGHDTLGVPGRMRAHTDDSVQYKYYDNGSHYVSKGAFSFTVDAGCESGGGTSCASGSAGSPAQYFLGFMAYNRLWFDHDKFALTMGGGAVTNPGRYLVLLPPIDGATATTGSAYFSQNPGDTFKAWDSSITWSYMPSQFVTFLVEFDHRQANVPYFAGSGGITPPGGNDGNPSAVRSGFQPDLSKIENRINTAFMVRL